MTSKAESVARGQKIFGMSALAVLVVMLVAVAVTRVGGGGDDEQVKASSSSSTSSSALPAGDTPETSSTDGSADSTTSTTAVADPGATTTTAKAGTATTKPSGPGATVTTVRTTTPAPATTVAAPVTTQGTTPPADGYTRRTDLEAQLLAKHNAARANAGLPALTQVSCATDIAQTWARHMAEAHSLSHNPSYASQLQGSCSNVRAWAENIAQQPTADAQKMFDTWMASTAGHRENILKSTVTRIGIGVWTTPDGVMWAAVDFVS